MVIEGVCAPRQQTADLRFVLLRSPTKGRNFARKLGGGRESGAFLVCSVRLLMISKKDLAAGARISSDRRILEAEGEEAIPRVSTVIFSRVVHISLKATYCGMHSL